MGEYYGNNDWRDYKALQHYGVKGMKWRKRKLPISITTENNGTNPYGHSSKGIYVRDKNGVLLSLTKSSHKSKGSRYEATVRRRKPGNYYDRSTKRISNYSDDPDYRTVGVKVPAKKRKSRNVRSRVSSILARLRKRG